MKTRTGFECDIPAERMDSMELLDALAEMEDGTITAFPRVLNLLLGSDKKRLYEHIKGRTGLDRVPLEEVSEEIDAIFEAIGDGAKN